MLYSCIGEKVQGAAHIKNQKPCQDAILIKNCNKVVIAAIADGHGSEYCPYSDEGAQVAVETIWEVFSQIAQMDTIKQIFTTLTANKEIWLPKQIENTWRKKICNIHNQKNRKDINDIYKLYGSTVLGVMVADSFIFALQLGDGDILSVNEELRARWLIEPDYIDGNETYSLCLNNSWELIKTCILPLDSTREAPVMIMLSTDGYANSFSSSHGFLKAGTDIYRLIQNYGTEYVQNCLNGWLSDSSQNGSGDDIALALIYRT